MNQVTNYKRNKENQTIEIGNVELFVPAIHRFFKVYVSEKGTYFILSKGDGKARIDSFTKEGHSALQERIPFNDAFFRGYSNVGMCQYKY